MVPGESVTCPAPPPPRKSLRTRLRNRIEPLIPTQEATLRRIRLTHSHSLATLILRARSRTRLRILHGNQDINVNGDRHHVAYTEPRPRPF